MVSQSGELEALPNRRIGSLIAPREHGAWGLLLVPLATGGVVGLQAGGNGFPLAAFTVAALTLFWLRSPVESWLGTGLLRAQTRRERNSVGITILILVAIAGLALASLFWEIRNRKGLLLLGLIAVVAVAGQSLLRKLGRRTRMLSQIVGTIGLTVTAPAAYFVVTGQLNREAWALWMANLLFAGNQIHYVQLRLHSTRTRNFSEKFKSGRGFFLGEILLAGTLAFACYSHWLNGLAALAFLPLLVRGAVWFFESPQPLLVRKLGWTELGHGVLFGLLLIAGFHLGS